VRRIGRYFALSASDRWDLVRAFAWITLVDLGLRTVGFQRLVGQARAGSTRPELAESGQAHRRAHRYAHWIDVAARHHVVQARCLHRSLALYQWLRCEGVRSELRIGVHKDRDELKAHAWIELAGCVVNDRPDAVAVFTPLATPDQRLVPPSARPGMVRAWE
jgi:hypothetical protein